MVCGAMMTAVLGFTSCEDDLDVQQAYPFTVRQCLYPSDWYRAKQRRYAVRLFVKGISPIHATQSVISSPMAREH